MPTLTGNSISSCRCNELLMRDQLRLRRRGILTFVTSTFAVLLFSYIHLVRFRKEAFFSRLHTCGTVTMANSFPEKCGSRLRSPQRMRNTQRSALAAARRQHAHQLRFCWTKIYCIPEVVSVVSVKYLKWIFIEHLPGTVYCRCTCR
uniref:Uncharacterized protein n=1 Tax=Parascaris univalens TaxID=6257 RepID=A0A914ZFE7_PARUN